MFHATSAMGIHGAIEWSNRILGVVVGLVAIAAFIAAFYRKPRRKSLLWLTAIVAVGVAAQGGIGAVLVGSTLTPWLVSIHFLVSIGLLAAAYTAWVRSGEPDGDVEPIVPTAVRHLWWVITAVAVVAQMVGTVVTGTGPHAGDPDAIRLGLNLELVSQLHADIVFLLIGLTVALVFTARAVSAPAKLRTAAWVLLAVELGQGLIGLVQYFTGLPELLVGAHLLGAALLWLAVLKVGAATRQRRPLAHLDPVAQPAADEAAESRLPVTSASDS